MRCRPSIDGCPFDARSIVVEPVIASPIDCPRTTASGDPDRTARPSGDAGATGTRAGLAPAAIADAIPANRSPAIETLQFRLEQNRRFERTELQADSSLERDPDRSDVIRSLLRPRNKSHIAIQNWSDESTFRFYSSYYRTPATDLLGRCFSVHTLATASSNRTRGAGPERSRLTACRSATTRSPPVVGFRRRACDHRADG